MNLIPSEVDKKLILDLASNAIWADKFLKAKRLGTDDNAHSLHRESLDEIITA